MKQHVLVLSLCAAAAIPATSSAQRSTAPAKPTADSTARAATERFVGFYEAQAGRGMEVTLANDTLYVEPTGGIKTRLILESGTSYSATPVAGGSTVTIAFTVNADGKVTELVFKSRGGERTFPKVR